MSEAPEDEGLIPRLGHKLLGRSWKTTLAGLVTLVAAVLPSIPGLPPVAYEIARVLAPLAAGSGLLLAKDKGVSGTGR